MSEFQELIALIRNVVLWILEATLNLLSSIILFASLTLPWRLLAFVFWRKPGMFESSHNFRKVSLVSFCVSVGDVVAIPFVVLGLLSPTRTCLVVATMVCRKEKALDPIEDELGLSVSKRFKVLGQSINGFVDVICITFGLVLIFVPTSTVETITAISKLVRLWYHGAFCKSPSSPKCFTIENTSKFLNVLNSMLVHRFCFVPSDIIMLTPGLLCSLFPSRTSIFYTTLRKLRSDNELVSKDLYIPDRAFLQTGLNGDDTKLKFVNRSKLYWLCIQTIVYSIRDTICLVLGAVSLCMVPSSVEVSVASYKLLMLWRRGGFVEYYSSNTCTENTENLFHELASLYCTCFCRTVMDFVFLPVGITFSFFPTRTTIFWNKFLLFSSDSGLVHIRKGFSKQDIIGEGDERQTTLKFVDRGKLYSLCVVTAACAFRDALCTILGMAALCCPTCTCELSNIVLKLYTFEHEGVAPESVTEYYGSSSSIRGGTDDRTNDEQNRLRERRIHRIVIRERFLDLMCKWSTIYFFFALLDLLFLPGAVAASCFPTRAHPFWRRACRLLFRSQNWSHTLEPYFDDRIDGGTVELRMKDRGSLYLLCLCTMMFTVGDVIFLPFGIVASFIPSRTFPLCRAFLASVNDPIKRSEIDIPCEMWVVCLLNFIYGILDVLVFPLWCIGYLSWTRGGTLRSELTEVAAIVSAKASQLSRPSAHSLPFHGSDLCSYDDDGCASCFSMPYGAGSLVEVVPIVGDEVVVGSQCAIVALRGRTALVTAVELPDGIAGAGAGVLVATELLQCTSRHPVQLQQALITLRHPPLPAASSQEVVVDEGEALFGERNINDGDEPEGNGSTDAIHALGVTSQVPESPPSSNDVYNDAINENRNSQQQAEVMTRSGGGGDGGVGGSAPFSPSKFPCPTCTLYNEAGTLRCSACGANLTAYNNVSHVLDDERCATTNHRGGVGGETTAVLVSSGGVGRVGSAADAVAVAVAVAEQPESSTATAAPLAAVSDPHLEGTLSRGPMESVVPAICLTSPPRVVTLLWFGYNWTVRWRGVVCGLLALCDVFFLPALFLLLVTRFRLNPAHRSAIFEGGDWLKPRRLGFSEYALILHLAGLLAVDLVLLPFTSVALALGFCCRRDGALRQAMRRELLLGLPAVEGEGGTPRPDLSHTQEARVRGRELHYYFSMCRCLLLSLVDVALFPAVLAAHGLAFWRTGPLRAALEEVAALNRDGLSSGVFCGATPQNGQMHFGYFPLTIWALFLAAADAVTAPLTALCCVWPTRGAVVRAAVSLDLGAGCRCCVGTGRRAGGDEEGAASSTPPFYPVAVEQAPGTSVPANRHSSSSHNNAINSRRGLQSAEVVTTTSSTTGVPLLLAIMNANAWVRYTEVGECFLYLLCDCVALVPWLLVKASHLRSDTPLARAATFQKTTPGDPQSWTGPAWWWYYEVFRNFALLLHDLFLLPIALLLTLLSVYRWRVVGFELFAACRCCSSNRQHNHRQHTTPLGPPPLPNSSSNSSSEQVRVNGNDDEEEVVEPMRHRLRYVAWGQAVGVLLDLPFAVLGVLLLLTLWRAQTLWTALHNTGLTATTATTTTDRQRRWVVVQQFGRLLVDVAVLPLLLIEVATCYRLPNVVGTLKAKYHVPLCPTDDDGNDGGGGGADVAVPVLMKTASAVRVWFPQKGPPVIKITGSLKSGGGNNHNNRMNDDDAAAAAAATRHADANRFSWTLVPGSCVLHVLSDPFWAGLSASVGSGPVSLARGFLPLKVADAPTHEPTLPPSSLPFSSSSSSSSSSSPLISANDPLPPPPPPPRNYFVTSDFGAVLRRFHARAPPTSSSQNRNSDANESKTSTISSFSSLSSSSSPGTGVDPGTGAAADADTSSLPPLQARRMSAAAASSLALNFQDVDPFGVFHDGEGDKTAAETETKSDHHANTPKTTHGAFGVLREFNYADKPKPYNQVVKDLRKQEKATAFTTATSSGGGGGGGGGGGAGADSGGSTEEGEEEEVSLTLRSLSRQTLVTKLSQLPNHAHVLLQVECRATRHEEDNANGGCGGGDGDGQQMQRQQKPKPRPCIAFSLPLNTSALLASLRACQHVDAERHERQPNAPDFVSLELPNNPTAVAQVCRGLRSSHVGVVDSFALVVVAEFAQLLKDGFKACRRAAVWWGRTLWSLTKLLLHVPILLLCLAAPWRLLELLCALFEPRRKGPARQAKRALKLLDETDSALQEYRCLLLPYCNRASKAMVVNGSGGKSDKRVWVGDVVALSGPALDKASDMGARAHTHPYFGGSQFVKGVVVGVRGGRSGRQRGKGMHGPAFSNPLSSSSSTSLSFDVAPVGNHFGFFSTLRNVPASQVAKMVETRSASNSAHVSLPRHATRWFRALETRELRFYEQQVQQVLSRLQGVAEWARLEATQSTAAKRSHEEAAAEAAAAVVAAEAEAEAQTTTNRKKKGRNLASLTQKAHQKEEAASRAATLSKALEGDRKCYERVAQVATEYVEGQDARLYYEASKVLLQVTYWLNDNQGPSVGSNSNINIDGGGGGSSSSTYVGDGVVGIDDATHARLLERVLDADAALAAKLRRLRCELGTLVLRAERSSSAAAANSTAQERNCDSRGGSRFRSASEVQQLCRDHCLLALQDLGHLLLLALVCATLYRVLPLLKDLKQAANDGNSSNSHPSSSSSSLRSSASPLDARVRFVVLRHLRAAGRDFRDLVAVLCLLALQLVTVVTLPAFTEALGSSASEANGGSGGDDDIGGLGGWGGGGGGSNNGTLGLSDVAALQMEHLTRFWLYLGRVFSLGLVFDTYRLLVRSAAYSVLVPPACIAEAARPVVDHLLLLCKRGNRSGGRSRDGSGGDAGAADAGAAGNGLGDERGVGGRSGGSEGLGDVGDGSNQASSSSSAKPRFWVSFVGWAALLLFSVRAALSAGDADDSSLTGDRTAPAIIGCAAILAPAFLVALLSSSTANNVDEGSGGDDHGSNRALPRGDFRSSTVRATWPNLLALLSIALEALQLPSLALLASPAVQNRAAKSSFVFLNTNGGSGEEEEGASSVILRVASAVTFSRAPLEVTYAAWGVVGLWLVAITLPLAATNDSPPSPSPPSSSASTGQGQRRRRSSGGTMNANLETGGVRRSPAVESDGDEEEVFRSGGGGVSSSPLFRHATSFLGSIAFVSTVVLLLPGGSSWARLGPTGRATSACAFLYYVVTTQVLSADSSLRSQKVDAGIDIRYPHLFAMGLQLCHLALVLLLVVGAQASPDWDGDHGGGDEDTHDGRSGEVTARHWLAVAAAAGLTLWCLLYPALRGAADGVCCVPFVGVLRSASAAAVLFTASAAMFVFSNTKHTSNNSRLGGGSVVVVWLGVGWAAVAVAAAVALAVVNSRSAEAHRRELTSVGGSASELLSAAKAMERVGGVLCVGEAVDAKWATEARRRVRPGKGGGGGGGWSAKLRTARTPQELARLLLSFEDKVLASRLCKEFVVARRGAWLREVASCQRAALVGLLAAELKGALVAPAFTRTLRKLVRQLLVAKRSSLYAEPAILAFLLGDTTAVRSSSSSSSSSSSETKVNSNGGGGGAAERKSEKWPAERTQEADLALQAALEATPSARPSHRGRLSFETHITNAGKKLNRYIQAIQPLKLKSTTATTKTKGTGCALS